MRRRWRPDGPLDVLTTLAPLRRGAADPTHRVLPDGTLWRTVGSPAGPATLRLHRSGADVDGEAWGPGAQWTLDALPALLGAGDDPAGFAPTHPLLRGAYRRHPGLRIPCTGLVFEQLCPAILEQKVTGVEARRSWRELTCRTGEPAPGPAPAGMRVAPTPAALMALPTWEWHRAGVDLPRRRALRAAASRAIRLEECTAMSPAAALARLQLIPGVGPWTAAETAQRALGDADAVSVGDFHIPSRVGWALLGRPIEDAEMLDLLEPYRPHRHRVVRLIELAAPRTPRFGPRATVRDHRTH